MATWRQERLNRNFHCYFPEGNIWLFISQMLHYVCSQLLTLTVSDSSPSLTFTVNRRIYFHQNKSMFLENNYQLLFLPPELVFNFIHVSDKMQHEVAGQTISSRGGGSLLRAQLGDSNRADTYLQVCTYISHLLLFLSSLSFAFSHCLAICASRHHRNYSWLLLSVKHTWLLVNKTTIPCC